MSYSKQTWVDDVTVVDAAAMNHMEDGIDNANKGAHPGFDYTIYRTGDTYVALNRDGTVATQSTDVVSPVASGLKAVLTAIAASNKSIFFRAGTYKFPEDPAGIEDHWICSGFRNLTLEGEFGYRRTIISNWRDASQGGYDQVVDTEPFSMGDCVNLTMRNLTIWHGGNRDDNDSDDATDFDACPNLLLENIVVERSRARAIILDGGDNGSVSDNAIIRGCRVQGIPERPQIRSGAAGSMTAQEYRYVVTYVDSVFGETPPSEVGVFTSPDTKQLNIRIPTGPFYDATRGVTQRKLYRWSAAQTTFRLVTTINDNTTTTYTDNATDASIASAAQPPVTTGTTLIPMEGIKLLGTRNCLVEGNVIVGCNSHGIEVSYKEGTLDLPASGNIIRGNHIRQTAQGTNLGNRAGIFIIGGDANQVSDNEIINNGTTTNKGSGISVWWSGASSPTRHTMIGSNVVWDNQGTNTPSGAVTTQWYLKIGGATAPDNTVVAPHVVRGTESSGDVSNGGTNTKQFTPA